MCKEKCDGRMANQNSRECAEIVFMARKDKKNSAQECLFIMASFLQEYILRTAENVLNTN